MSERDVMIGHEEGNSQSHYGSVDQDGGVRETFRLQESSEMTAKTDETKPTGEGSSQSFASCICLIDQKECPCNAPDSRRRLGVRLEPWDKFKTVVLAVLAVLLAIWLVVFSVLLATLNL